MDDSINEKAGPTGTVVNTTDGTVSRPAGWKYKEFRIGPFRIPWYASPPVQLVIIAFVCFLCPGMFNAVTGMGGGGQVDTSVADNANTAVYSTFAVVGFFAGSIVNTIGIKASLAFGGLGYCIYVAAFLCYSHTANAGFDIFAGALLGVCAGILWSAQGAIMLAYPPERSKGRYISVFWMIFNLGGVIGALIPLGQNIHATGDTTVSDGTYIGFIVLTFLGACLALTLANGKAIIRDDGSRVIMMKNPTWKTEIIGLWETLFTDPYILLLFPMFFASNWFYTYQFNAVNAARFNTRTRALNNVLYWFFQIVGAFFNGFALDFQGIRRSVRSRILWANLVVLTLAIWAGAYAWQKGYTRAETTPKTYVKMDWTDSGYIGPMFLYIFFGIYDAVWQTSVYWLMGAMSNNSRKVANFAGFYKGIQSAGAAVIWKLDGDGLLFMNEFASCWGLLLGGLVVAAPVIFMRIKDTVDLEDDLQLTDETAADVVPVKIEEPVHDA